MSDKLAGNIATIRYVETLNMLNNQYVQYGCGFSAPSAWRNFDASPTLRIERLPLFGKLPLKNNGRFPANVEFGNIVKGLPLPNDSCKAIYSSHILEHLSLNDFRAALVNTYKILEKNGVFRFVQPDLQYYIKNYMQDTSSGAAIDFIRGTGLGAERRHRGLKAFIFDWLGNSRHLWLWDYKAIEKELFKAGFRGIRRARFGDAKDPMFKEIELLDRWEDCLGVECKK